MPQLHIRQAIYQLPYRNLPFVQQQQQNDLPNILILLIVLSPIIIYGSLLVNYAYNISITTLIIIWFIIGLISYIIFESYAIYKNFHNIIIPIYY